MMEIECDVKSMKKDLSFTNERIDYITKGDKKYTTLDQSTIKKTLEDNNNIKKYEYDPSSSYNYRKYSDSKYEN